MSGDEKNKDENPDEGKEPVVVKAKVQATDVSPESEDGAEAKVSEDTMSDAEKVVRLTRENLALREQAQKGAVMDKVMKVERRLVNLLQEENCSPIEFEMAVALIRPQLMVNTLKMEQAFREQTAAKGSQPDGKFKAVD